MAGFQLSLECSLGVPSPCDLILIPCKHATCVGHASTATIMGQLVAVGWSELHRHRRWPKARAGLSHQWGALAGDMSPSASWLLSSLRSEPELAGALVALLEHPPEQPSESLLGALDELSQRIDISEATQQLARTAISQLTKPSTDTDESGSHDRSSSDSSSDLCSEVGTGGIDLNDGQLQAEGTMALEDAQLQAEGTMALEEDAQLEAEGTMALEEEEADSTDGMLVEGLDLEEPSGMELECLQLESHVPAAEEMAMEEFVSDPGPASPQPDPTVGAPRWTMGKDCHGYVGRRYRPVEEQSQVLVANAVEKLRMAKPSSSTRAPAQLERQVLAACPTNALLQELLHRCPVPAQHAVTHSAPFNVVAGLCCISPFTVAKIWKHAATHRAPESVRPSGPSVNPVGTTADTDQDRQDVARRTLIRTALSNASEGRPHNSFKRDLARLRLAGAPVGEKYVGRWAAPVLEHVGATVCSQVLNSIQSTPLGSLGIPSDIELFLDPATIGRIFHSVRSTVCLIGMTVSCPGHCSGESVALFVDAPSCGLDQTSTKPFENIQWALESGTYQLSTRVLRQRLAITNSDGAYAAGETSRHSTSSLWDDLWTSIGRSPRVGWDCFHRLNIAGKRALHSSQLAEQFLALTKDLEAVFGGGQGRMLDRQVAIFMDSPVLTGMVPAGTRELGYLAAVPARFLDKWKTYYIDTELRRQHAEDNRGSRPATWWVQFGLQLASVELLTFVHGLHHLLAAVQPLVLLVQSPSTLPEERADSQTQCFTKLNEVHSAFGAIGGHTAPAAHILFIFQLISRYVDAPSMQFFLSVYCLSKWHRSVPRLAAWLPEVMMHHKWQGCPVSLDYPIPSEGHTVLHPACQCAFRRVLPRSQQASSSNQPSTSAIPVEWPQLSQSRAVRHQPAGRRKRRQAGPPVVSMAPWVAPASLLLGQKDYTRERSPCAVGVETPLQSMRQPPTRSCRLPPQQRHTVAQIGSGLQSLCGLASQLAKELGDYLGDVGVTRPLAHIWDSHCSCFSLSTLTQRPPSDTMIVAFQQLYTALLPDLQHTLWPPPSWPVDHKMPDEAPVDQYKTLARYIHDAWRLVRPGHTWAQQTTCQVAAVLRLPPVCKQWAGCTSVPVLSIIAHMVCGSCWTCKAHLLKAPRPVVFQSGCFNVVAATSKQAGDVAVLTVRRRAQFVVIVEEHLRPAVRAIAASLESDPQYSSGCWHALRVWHRSRRMGISEAPSESWASVLSRLWNPVHGPLTGVLIDRLRLHVSGYRGVPSDEHIVNLVASHLPSVKPFRARKSVNRGPVAQRGMDTHALFNARAECDPDTSRATDLLRSEMACTIAEEMPVGSTVSLSHWNRAMQLHHQDYDRACLSTRDIDVLLQCRSGKTPALPLHILTKPQRAKWKVASVNRSVQDAMRRKTLARRGKRATPDADTPPVATDSPKAATVGRKASRGPVAAKSGKQASKGPVAAKSGKQASKGPVAAKSGKRASKGPVADQGTRVRKPSKQVHRSASSSAAAV